MESHVKYRNEINGLRAISIIAVIANHIDEQIFSNGFLGVDVFFVISGFVITSSIFSKPHEPLTKFLKEFYSRRFKRLYPSLLTMVLFTSVICSFFIRNPMIFLQTGFTSLFGASNFFLVSQKLDYFAPSTSLNPFAHTWSLGVEEQFYLMFPIFVWILRRPQAKSTSLLAFNLMIVASSSLALFLISPNQTIESHYLLQYRIWELAVGSLAYLYLTTSKRIRIKLPFVSEIGLAIVIFLLTGPIPLEVRTTKITVAVITVFLLVHLNERDSAYKVLTLKPVTKIGLISYSLYLWHQPIITMTKWTIGQHFWLVPIQLILIFSIANISFKWIEQPIIFADSLISAKRTFTLIISSAVLAMSVIFSLWRPLITKFPIHSYIFLGSENQEQLPNAPIDFYDEKSRRFAGNCHTSDRARDALNGRWILDEDFLTNCLNGDAKNLIAFVGDSHTLSMFPVAIDISNSKDATTFVLSRDGCAYPSQGPTTRTGCNEIMANTSEFLIKKMRLNGSRDAIVATSRLLSYFTVDGAHSRQFGNGNSPDSVRKNLVKYLLALTELAANLRLGNDYLVVTAPLPYFQGLENELCEDQWFRPNALKNSTCFGTPRIELLRQREEIMSALNDLADRNENVIIFDGFDVLCPNSEVCKPKLRGELTYSDADHLNAVGARTLLAPLMKTLQKYEIITNNP